MDIRLASEGVNGTAVGVGGVEDVCPEFPGEWQTCSNLQTKPGWWFGTFFVFPHIANNHPNGLIYFSEGLKPPTEPETISVWEICVASKSLANFEPRSQTQRHRSCVCWITWCHAQRRIESTVWPDKNTQPPEVA